MYIKNKISKTLDNSNMLRALLVLIIKDRQIVEHEKRIFLEEGVKLGFDKEFLEEAVRNGLRNENIRNDVPVFLERKIAMDFLRIAIQILKEDVALDERKIRFMEKTAEANGLLRHWKVAVKKTKLYEKPSLN
jgi:hypothetical protein